MRRMLLAFFSFVISVGGQTAASTPRRVAFLFGNSAYSRLTALPSVPDDIEAMSASLKRADFDVTVIRDIRLPEFFKDSETLFKRSVRPGDVCLIYYSGYAVHKDDDTYLLPVNFDPRAPGDIQARAFHFKLLQQLLDAAGPAIRVFVLEASRPIAEELPARVYQGVIAPDVEEYPETFWASSASFESTSAPASGLSKFTKFWATHMDDPGLALVDIFEATRRDVYEATNHEQNPAYRTSLAKQEFRFREPLPTWPRAGVPVPNRVDREEYLWIPADKFLMGCVPGDPLCEPQERPQHEVVFTKGFWIGRNEVTVGSYQRYVDQENNERKKRKVKPLKMPSAPGYNPGWRVSDDPMDNVRWTDAAAYCQWAGGRLPTEAEWEYAYRAGKKNEIYPGGIKNFESARDHANFYGKQGNDIWDDMPAPVRKFDPNAFGLFDLAGNVWEWVADFYSKSAFTAEPQRDPVGPPEGREHVIRGGGYDADPKLHLRLSVRRGMSSDSPEVGFRCALPDTTETRKNLIDPAKQ